MASPQSRRHQRPCGLLLQLVLLLCTADLAARACLIAKPGKQACTAAKCGNVDGYIQYYNGTDSKKTGGTNLEFYSSLLVNVLGYHFLKQVPAANHASCCRECAKDPECNLFRFFPTDASDPRVGSNFFTAASGMSPCSCSTGKCLCNNYNQWDISRNCILIKFNASACTATGATCPLSRAGSSTKPYCFFCPSSGLGPSFIARTNPSVSSSPWPSTARRSYFGGTCSPGVTVDGDPHFVGAEGVQFEFNGEIGKSFCLLTDRNLHINMEISGYQDERMLMSTAHEGKNIRSWITGLGAMWKDKAQAEADMDAAHTLLLRTRTGPEQSRGVSFVSEFLVDGVPQAIPSKEGDSVTVGSLSLRLLRQAKVGPFDYDEYILSIGDLLRVKLGARVAHPLLQREEEAYAHFNIRVESIDSTHAIHGVLGQSLRGDTRTVARALEYKLLSSLLRAPIHADADSGRGFLDGEPSDYITSSVTAADCKFAQAWNEAEAA